jgi:YgiT-type zinc finger domain-containing protein
MSKRPSYPCPECQVGALRPRAVSFFSMYAGQPVTVPDFPAWVCDVCGRREYDSAALAELQAMLESGRSRGRRRQARQPGQENPPPPPTPGSRR